MKNQKRSLLVLAAITAVAAAAIMLFVWPGLLLDGVHGPNAPRSAPTAHGNYSYVTVEHQDPETGEVTKTVTITGYRGRGPEAVIPSALNGAPVTVIAEGVFEDCAALQRVHLPAGLKEIGARAFRFCSQLKEAELPNGLETIGDRAFFDCTELTAMALPESVTRIGEDAFASCVRLENVPLPDSLREIGSGAFRKCTALGALALPAGELVIGDGAFLECPHLDLQVVEGSPAEMYCLSHKLLPTPTPVP